MKKKAYVIPRCRTVIIETQSMMCGSNDSISTNNEDVNLGFGGVAEGTEDPD
mgnify:CR=1 FL=1